MCIYMCVYVYIYIILETRDKPWRYCGGIVYDVAAVDPINSTHSSVIDQLLWRVGIHGSRQTKRSVTNEEGKRVLFLIMPASLISSWHHDRLSMLHVYCASICHTWGGLCLAIWIGAPSQLIGPFSPSHGVGGEIDIFLDHSYEQGMGLKANLYHISSISHIKSGGFLK